MVRNEVDAVCTIKKEYVRTGGNMSHYLAATKEGDEDEKGQGRE